MRPAGRRGAYRKEERAELSSVLQKELVDCAAGKIGNCQELAKVLEVPKSSVHYYRRGRLTLPLSVMEQMLKIAADDELEGRVREASVTKGRTWANAYAAGIHRELCRERVRLPTIEDLENNNELRRKAAAIVSYVLAEGSIWMRNDKCGEGIVNITFSDEEMDLYEHFRRLCVDVFAYDIGPPQMPGNGARAVRGFIYSRFIAEWLMANGVCAGDKSSQCVHLPKWVLASNDTETHIASLQPWCDGEGCVSNPGHGSYPRFMLAQARHTDLDLAVIPRKLCNRKSGRHLSLGILSLTEVFGIPALDYCNALHRSEVLDDIAILFCRLGFRPKVQVTSLYLKDDGFWSCTWGMYFSSADTKKLAAVGLITQRKKLARCRCP